MVRTTTDERHPESSADYKATNGVCSLFDARHGVSGDIAAVLDAVADCFDDVEVAATGCGSCFDTDATVGVFYTAQSPGTAQSLYLKYDVDDDADVTRYGVGAAIVGAAHAVGVPVEWDGDTSTAIHVGDGGQ